MYCTNEIKFKLTLPQPYHGQQPKPGRGGGLNTFYWYQILALDAVVFKTQNCLARIEAS